MHAVRRIARLVPALVALAGFPGCRAGGGSRGGGGGSGLKLTLRYHPPAGASYQYALEQQNSMKLESGPQGQFPGQELTMRMYFTQSVTGPAEGGIGVTVKFDSTMMESPMMGAGAMTPALDRMRGLTSNIVYDDRMHVVRAAFSGVAGMPSPITEQMGKSVKGMAFPLPDAPVGVGDSWTSETELPLGEILNASAPLKATTKLTVREIQTAGADTAVLLGIETRFPGDPVTLTQQGQSITLRLSGSLTGEQLFSVTKGAAVRSAMGGTMKINVRGGPMGPQGMTMAMQQQTSLQLTGAQ